MKTNTKCPHCNYNATEHETLHEQKNPTNGDVSICINCGELSEYKNGSLIKKNISTLDSETKKEVEKIQKAWLQTKHMNPLKKD